MIGREPWAATTPFSQALKSAMIAHRTPPWRHPDMIKREASMNDAIPDGFSGA